MSVRAQLLAEMVTTKTDLNNDTECDPRLCSPMKFYEYLVSYFPIKKLDMILGRIHVVVGASEEDSNEL